MRRLLILCLLLFLALPAHAAESARERFQTLAHAVVKGDAPTARTCFTKRSLALYDRFIGYGLLPCLPKDATYISETPAGETMLVKGSITDLADKKRVMKLIFMKDEGAWKFDLPATLERSMGNKWENQLHLSEQIYLLLRAQIGERFQCSTLKEFVKTEDTP